MRLLQLLETGCITLYARGDYASSVKHPSWGMFFPPNPYWVIRLLALENPCASCGRSADEVPLRITMQSARRFANPLSLFVACLNHDPLRDERLLERRLLVKNEDYSG